MTTDQPRSEAAAQEMARVDKLLETTQNQVVRAKWLAKDMDQIKRVNGIAAALNQRWERKAS